MRRWSIRKWSTHSRASPLLIKSRCERRMCVCDVALVSQVKWDWGVSIWWKWKAKWLGSWAATECYHIIFSWCLFGMRKWYAWENNITAVGRFTANKLNSDGGQTRTGIVVFRLRLSVWCVLVRPSVRPFHLDFGCICLFVYHHRLLCPTKAQDADQVHGSPFHSVRVCVCLCA